MGSINCKEYKTANNPGNAQDSGDTGSYKFKPESDMDSEDYIEAVVCNEADIKNHEMKQVSLNEDAKVLLIKQNGRITAVGNKCPHYGALLASGTLGDGRVRCPFHGACFNVETGDIEDFPGLDSIPCYKVDVKGGQVRVRAQKSELEKGKRIKDMVKRDDQNESTFVIIGGGPSGAVCAETLRQEGFTGRIVMICKENTQPYDRVKTSKVFDAELTALQFRDMSFLDEYSIEMLLGVEATKVDTTEQTVDCSNGYSIKYDKLYIATGSEAVKPPIPGANLQNVFTIRNYADAAAINALINDQLDVVCLGSSFIALEAASALVKKVKSVTLVARTAFPLESNFGNDIGKRILKLFRANKVNMIMKSGIEEIIGQDGKVSEVVLNDGTKLPCGMCIMGTGARYYTDFLKDSNITLNDDGSIDTNTNLMTNIPNVFAGGDIANAPVFALDEERATIGHYQLAQYHGRIAAINMTGKAEELRAVPFFWTVLFGLSFRYSGYGMYSEVKIIGDLEELKFVAFYMDEADFVIAVASCGRDPVVSQFAEFTAQGKRLNSSDIEEENPFIWTETLSRARQQNC